MTDLDHILPLWEDLRSSGIPFVLATVVAVEGSGYRKPGARMMIAADGRRAGTISGGCLEGEVARKAFWHTADGPVLRHYSTSPEDGDVPFGMGCGGVIHLLLERAETAEPLLRRLAVHHAERTPLAVATSLARESLGERSFWPASSAESTAPSNDAPALDRKPLQDLARQGYDEQSGFSSEPSTGSAETESVCVEWIAARPGLFVFGAGDDAVPLVQLARQLGWYVSVADGRSNLATAARFPEAHEVHVLPVAAFPELDFRATDAAAVMTHSLEQDTRILATLLKTDLTYIGVLGPRRRTGEILASLAETVPGSAQIAAQDWMDRLHAPMGLDLGGDTPAEIALSVIAEIQRNRRQRTGLPLRQVRAHGRAQIRALPESPAVEARRFSA